MGVEFVHVVTERERKQGAVYFAVAYWQVTLVVLGLAVVVGMLTSRR